jgi:hypothetical protein
MLFFSSFSGFASGSLCVVCLCEKEWLRRSVQHDPHMSNKGSSVGSPGLRVPPSAAIEKMGLFRWVEKKIQSPIVLFFLFLEGNG